MTYVESHPLAQSALEFHHSEHGDCNCAGVACPAVQRLIAFGEVCVMRWPQRRRVEASKLLALTVCQPYAHLISTGVKPIENREWATAYRGLLLIHAGKSTSWLEGEDPSRYVFGAIESVVTLRACIKRLGDPELVTNACKVAMQQLAGWGKWTHLYDHEHAHGPYCWILEDAHRLPEPVPCSGHQKLWRPDRAVVDAVATQLGWELW